MINIIFNKKRFYYNTLEGKRSRKKNSSRFEKVHEIMDEMIEKETMYGDEVIYCTQFFRKTTLTKALGEEE